jgi:D-alanine transaminase
LTGIKNPYTREQWQLTMQSLINANKDQYIYLQITRGAALKRDHAFPVDIEPTVFMMCNDIVPLEGKEHGVKAISLEDNRWILCHIKAIALLGNILMRQRSWCVKGMSVKGLQAMCLRLSMAL